MSFHYPSTFLFMALALTTAQINCVLTLLQNNKSGHTIASFTGTSAATISCLYNKYLSELLKIKRGHPQKLKSANIYYTTCLITSCKDNTATELTPILFDIIQQPLYPKTVCQRLKSGGLKSAVGLKISELDCGGLKMSYLDR